MLTRLFNMFFIIYKSIKERYITLTLNYYFIVISILHILYLSMLILSSLEVILYYLSWRYTNTYKLWKIDNYSTIIKFYSSYYYCKRSTLLSS